MIVTLADPYLAQNAGRRYPLADDTTGLADTSLVDFRATVRGISVGAFPQATLTRIEDVTTTEGNVRRLTVTLTSGTTPLGSLLFDIPQNIATAAPYTRTAQGATASGELTVMASILSEATGSYALPFAKTTVSAATLSVDSLQSEESIDTTPTTPGDTGPTAVLTGEVVLLPGYNAEPYLDGKKLHVDIFKGAGIGERCQTESTDQNCDNVLFTINGERPDSTGNINLTGRDGVSITPDPDHHALIIKIDTAADGVLSESCEPTCGG